MQISRMRYLLSSSCLILLVSCTTLYKNLQPANGNASDLEKFRPQFSVALYNTTVDVLDNHLSGLLLIKKMPDSSIRMVFSNEIGFKFFDFEFSATDGFKVYSIIKKMNKKAVIKTLQKDFELILMNQLDAATVKIRKDENLKYYTFPQRKGYYHYITNLAGDSLVRMERASNRKQVVEVVMNNYINHIPDTISVEHKNFHFTIGLKRIER